MSVRQRLGLLSLLLVSTGVFAGEATEVPLEIDELARTAKGNMVTVRFSDNEVDVIGCGTRAKVFTDGNLSHYAFCQAVSAAGDRAFCETENVELVNTIRQISDYAFITFKWDENNQCTYFGTSTQSKYIPQHLGGKKGKGKRKR